MNYATLSTALQTICQTTETTFVANIPMFVQVAERKIHMEAKLPTNRKNATGLSTTVGARNIVLPTDYINVKSIEITTAAGVVNLLSKAAEYLNEMYPVTATQAQPKFWAHYDETSINIAPTPDQIYPLTLHYFAMPASIVTAGTTWLGTNYEHVLLYGSVIQAYTFLKGAPDVMTYYQTQYDAALAELKGVASESKMQSFR